MFYTLKLLNYEMLSIHDLRGCQPFKLFKTLFELLQYHQFGELLLNLSDFLNIPEYIRNSFGTVFALKARFVFMADFVL